MESMTSGNPMVDAIGRLDFNGNIISRKYSMICLAEDGKKKIQCDGILLDTVSKGGTEFFAG